jgi:hypothetical protein
MDVREYYSKCIDVTPHNSNAFSLNACRGILVTVSGTIAFKDENGDTRTTGNLEAGKILPIQTKHILSTGTDATGIQAWY